MNYSQWFVCCRSAQYLVQRRLNCSAPPNVCCCQTILKIELPNSHLIHIILSFSPVFLSPILAQILVFVFVLLVLFMFVQQLELSSNYHRPSYWASVNVKQKPDVLWQMYMKRHVPAVSKKQPREKGSDQPRNDKISTVCNSSRPAQSVNPFAKCTGARPHPPRCKNTSFVIRV